MTFQRARSEEQRQVRRRAILETAAAMLDEMPVADVSLNELSRRVGLAKSNVLRYFDSREAVLLELLDDFLADWLRDLEQELAAGIDADAAPQDRARRLAEVISASLAARPVLCDLFGAQGGVLEHNVSVEVVTRHKRTSLALLDTMAGIVRRHLPEIGDARLFSLTCLVMAGAVSSYVPPPASVLAAYAADPALAVLHLDLREALEVALTSALLGVLPRD
ncbi:TetR family transcriptional regulator [Cellulomonas sp. zg-ZUI199]|uniref:TetR family transcriptional regulator n=1 Tax=Cellulomonas wangleii TaxID=2816956 RepID=A0ABX8D4G9_9CELL|nr:TetR family transcriptional regulator [Cellulomonas wangleii]MBO0924300.1 TetR family transcriptional regulator [Cellulomonas wangleii]QVI62309.1 TetR family transcriptional regulator [Cellulomonas wangleii]